MSQRKSATGVTLIELMLALSLSVLILGMIIETYVAANATHEAQTALNAIQENARSASEFLSTHIRAAGFIGCARLTDEYPFTHHLEINLPRPVSHYQDKEMKTGTDAIAVWHAGNASVLLMKTMKEKNILYVSTGFDLAADDWLIISDCKTTETFAIKTVSVLQNGWKKIISAVPLEKLYEKNAEINQFEIDNFFISDTGRETKNHQPVYALYVRMNGGRKMELAEGVDDMQARFSAGIKTHGAAIVLRLSSVTHFSLHKNWYLYAALRNT